MAVTPAPFEHYQFGFGSPYASHAQSAGSVVARAYGVPPTAISGGVGASLARQPTWGGTLSAVAAPFAKGLRQRANQMIRSRQQAFGQPPPDDGIREVGPTGIRTATYPVRWNQRPLTQASRPIMQTNQAITQAQRPIMTAMPGEEYEPHLDWAAQPQPVATIGGAMSPALKRSRTGSFGYGSGASGTA